MPTEHPLSAISLGLEDQGADKKDEAPEATVLLRAHSKSGRATDETAAQITAHLPLGLQCADTGTAMVGTGTGPAGVDLGR